MGQDVLELLTGQHPGRSLDKGVLSWQSSHHGGQTETSFLGEAPITVVRLEPARVAPPARSKSPQCMVRAGLQSLLVGSEHWWWTVLS